jgi:CheY-like chemotaxis protein
MILTNLFILGTMLIKAKAGPTTALRPPLLRSAGSFAKGVQDMQMDTIMFRIDNEDNVVMWKGRMHATTNPYEDPPINSNIIDYWRHWSLLDVIETYLCTKDTKEIGTLSRPVDDCWYSWKFYPHGEHAGEVSGYIFDTTSMITAGGAEVERQFSEMKASLFRILSHLVRNPLSQMTMGIDEISEALPVLSLTRKTPFVTTMGKRVTFDATSKQVSEHIESIKQQAALLMRTHSLMEDYISVGDGHAKLQLSCFDLVDTVMGIWQKWRDIGLAKRVDVELEIEPMVKGRHPSITTDKVRLGKCIVAILENAVQSAAGTSQYVNGEVFLHVALDKHSIRITVQDSGPGMQPEALQELIERLHSGEISFHEEGEMGLGISLALAYHMVTHLFQGKMWLRSLGGTAPYGGDDLSSSDGSLYDLTPLTDGLSKIPIHQFRHDNVVGFVAQILIPLQDDSVIYFSSRDKKIQEGKEPVRDVSPSRDYGTGDRKGSLFARPPMVIVNGESMYVPLRDAVLIADDDPVNLKMLAKMLTKEGHKHVITATDGQVALNLYQTHHRKLLIILTDVQMPNMNGIELASKVRQYETTYGISPTIPIVAITASGTGSEARHRCMEAGMSEVLSKPFTRKDINSAIIKWGL